MNLTPSGQRDQETRKRRRSAWVTISVAAAIVVGAPVLFYQCSADEDEPVKEGQAYANNHYVPGAGYYHAGYFGFFPFRHNHFDAGRGGYFAGGSWRQTPDNARNLTSSVPGRAAVASANNQFRSTKASSRGGFGRSGGFFSGRS